jgi:hypothetical protein
MAEKWEKQFKDFIKRTGEEIKVEAQRIIDEVRDPVRQAKVKDALKDLRDKAAAVTKEAGEMLEGAVKKVESAFDKNKPEEPPKAQPAAAPAAPASKPARKSGKTIGKKAGAKKAAAAKAPAAKKTPKSIGKKKKPPA